MVDPTAAAIADLVDAVAASYLAEARLERDPIRRRDWKVAAATSRGIAKAIRRR